MKNASIILLLFFATLSFCAQSPEEWIVLTSKDVDAASVRVITNPTNAWQNVVFRFVGKTSSEIEAIVKKNCDVKILRDGIVMAQTDGGSGAMMQGGTNYIGLALLFSKYDQAKLAEKILRGE